MLATEKYAFCPALAIPWFQTLVVASSHLLGNRALVDEAVDAADVLVVAARAHNHLRQLQLRTTELIKPSDRCKGGRSSGQKSSERGTN